MIDEGEPPEGHMGPRESLLRRVGIGVQQGRHQGDRPHPEARPRDLILTLPHRQRERQHRAAPLARDVAQSPCCTRSSVRAMSWSATEPSARSPTWRCFPAGGSAPADPAVVEVELGQPDSVQDLDGGDGLAIAGGHDCPPATGSPISEAKERATRPGGGPARRACKMKAQSYAFRGSFGMEKLTSGTCDEFCKTLRGNREKTLAHVEELLNQTFQGFGVPVFGVIYGANHLAFTILPPQLIRLFVHLLDYGFVFADERPHYHFPNL